MLNSLSELSKQTFDDDTNGRVASSNVEVLQPVLGDDEAITYVMVSTKGIEHTTESRTTTITPDADHSTYAVVTGQRVLFLVGTGSNEVSVDIEFEMVDVTMADARSGLLSNSLIVTANQTNSVKFVPTSEADLAAVADYIDRIADAWQDLRQSLAGARRAIEDFEDALAAGGDTHEEVQTAQSRLSSAIHAATRNDDGPSEVMMARIEAVQEELDALLVRSRMDRIDTLVGEAEAAVADGELTATIEAIVEADERLADAEEDLENAEATDEVAWDALDAATDDVDEVAQDAIEAALDRCRTAAATDDPAAAVDAWVAAGEWFVAAREAGWDGPGGVTREALAVQEAYVTGRRIDAMRRAAIAEEATADELGETHDDAADHYEAALDHLETAQAIAEDHPHAGTTALDDAIERIEEKREVTEWEWGQA
jgi:hypothetical protein